LARSTREDPPRLLHEAAAYDGTKHYWFNMIRKRLRVASSEIEEQQLYLAYQRQRLADLEAMSHTMTDLSKATRREQIERPYPTRAFTEDLLEVLQLMCEGHDENMQNFLRTQPTLEDVRRWHSNSRCQLCAEFAQRDIASLRRRLKLMFSPRSGDYCAICGLKWTATTPSR
jgi:hypothetical protein